MKERNVKVIDSVRSELARLLEGFEEIFCGKELVIYGCGNTSVLYQNGFSRERMADQISFYVDQKAEQLDRTFYGKKVILPQEMENYIDREKSNILVCSDNLATATTIQSELNKRGFQVWKIDQYFFMKNRDRVLQVYDLLEDDYSKKVYAQLIKNRMHNQDIDDEFFSEKQYFAIKEFRVRDANETIVDVGAFVGDSVEQYIWNKMGEFNRIYSFEPSVANFNAMKMRVERLKQEWGIADDKIILINAGIGRENGRMHFGEADQATLGSSFNETACGEEREIYTIDTYFEEQSIDVLKADIESYEYDMLLGAKNVIKRDKPKLAICIYHNAVDFFSIPLLIKSINPTYRFSVRHHTYMLSDTVLYAY